MKKLSIGLMLLTSFSTFATTRSTACLLKSQDTSYKSVKLTHMNGGVKVQVVLRSDLVNLNESITIKVDEYDSVVNFDYDDFANVKFLVNQNDSGTSIFSHFVSDGPVITSFYECKN